MGLMIPDRHCLRTRSDGKFVAEVESTPSRGHGAAAGAARHRRRAGRVEAHGEVTEPKVNLAGLAGLRLKGQALVESGRV